MIRRLLLLVAGLLALFAIGAGARAQEAPVPVPATLERESVVSRAVEPGFEREVGVPADLYGVSWQGEPTATFAIETLERQGWTAAQEVGRQEHGPDLDTAESTGTAIGGPYATEPLWSGNGSAVRVRLLAGTAKDVQVIAVTAGEVPDGSATDPAALALGSAGAIALAAATLGPGATGRLRSGAAVALVIAIAVTGLVAAQDEAEAGVGTKPPHLISRNGWGGRGPQARVSH
jgi:hypothetical protein